MFCKKCGMQIDDNASFCEHCGADQRPAPAPFYQEAFSQPDYSHQPPEPAFTQQPTAADPTFAPLPGPAFVKSTPYLVWSILVTIFCCMPLGIPAIIFAAKIDNCNIRGDFAAAADNARKAKNFCIWGAAISAALFVIYLMFMVLMFAETNFHF